MADPAIPSGSEWHSSLGVLDKESGDRLAWEARNHILDAGTAIFSSAPMSITDLHIIYAGLVARLQSLHEGAIGAIRADNPHAAFTVLRAYFETVAVVFYTTEKPEQAKRLMEIDQHPIKIGQITNYAAKRFRGFAEVYRQLSSYTHPTAMGVLASHQIDEGRRFTWSSAPRFKSDGDRLTAYAWAIEFADASGELLLNFADVHRLRTPS